MSNVVRLPVGKSPSGGYRKLDDNALARLEKRYAKLARELRRSRGSSNTADVRALRELLLMTWELIPIAKESYKQYRSDRSIYALNGLVNQVREIMTDLRQLRTGKRQHRDIINKIVLPNLTVLMQHYMSDCVELRKQISKLPSSHRRAMTTALDNAMQQHGQLFNQASDSIQQALAEYLVA